MTRAEASRIPDLQISLADPLLEDCFYYQMAKEGRIDGEHAEKAIRRMEKIDNEISVATIRKALQMIENLDRYGVPCADWCKG